MGGGRRRQEIKERETKQELRRQVRTLPQVSFSQGCRMRGAGENLDGGINGHILHRNRKRGMINYGNVDQTRIVRSNVLI